MVLLEVSIFKLAAEAINLIDDFRLSTLTVYAIKVVDKLRRPGRILPRLGDGRMIYVEVTLMIQKCAS